MQNTSGTASQTSVLSLMQFKSDLYGDRTAFHFREDQRWKELTYSELSKKVRTLSDYLIERGLGQGDRIAIFSESRPEWAIAFFAAIRSGAVVVPLDIKLTQTELVSILTNAEPRVMFVSSQMIETVSAIKDRLPFVEEIFLLDEKQTQCQTSPLDALQPANEQEGRERDLEETALIVYTSGTTGAPKGVMISFHNLGYQVMNFECVMKLTSEDTLLSMLPLNHLLELTCGLLGVLYAGGSICYCQSLFPQEIAQIMREKKVTAMITVPLFLKMLKAGIEKESQRRGRIKRRMFQLLLKVSAVVRLPFARRRLFYEIHKKFGGRFRNFISGGAPLEPETARFFDLLGMPIYQGYGLTETSPVISVNTPQHNRMGSVGRPLPGARVRIFGKDGGAGEILTAGPHVMKGYYKRRDLTDEVIDDEGWFHTGDLGHLDQDGFLYVTGRIKNLIVLGSGMKVNPEEVEAIISASPEIKEVCVLGRLSSDGILRGTEEVCAVVIPAESMIQQFKERASLQEAIKKEVDRRALELATYKRPSKVFVRFEDLPKTSTRKIKRAVVLEMLDSEQAISAAT
ncbi:MAG: AMP-binding protein [Blastocatellia bacterium]